MSIYTPPSDNTPIFDDAFFSTGDLPLTYNQAVKKFLRYPIAQGTQNLLNVNISGTTAITGRVSQLLYGSGGTVADQNVQYGDSGSLSSTLTTGQFNTAIGYGTLDTVSSGSSNTCVGHDAGTAIIAGSSNTCIGQGAGKAITSGTNNVCIGVNAGSIVTGTSGSVYIGRQVLGNNSNCIVINATSTNLQSASASALYINPMRLQSASTNTTTSGNFMYYDTNAKEVLYLPPKLNAGFPLTMALDGLTDVATTLNGNSTYLGSYVITAGTVVSSITTGNTFSIVAVTIPVGVCIVSITETTSITGATPVITRQRRTLSTAATINTPAVGTTIQDIASGPTAIGSYTTQLTFTAINNTASAISGNYVTNFVFSAGTFTVQANATTIKIA